MAFRSKHIAQLSLIMAATLQVACSTGTNSLDSRTKAAINQLDMELRHKSDYEHNKENLISYLRDQAEKSTGDQDRFTFLWNLYEEYRNYQSDSAIAYGHRMLNLAEKINDSTRIQQANLALTEIHTASGLFMEAKEFYDQIDTAKLSPAGKALFGNISQRLFQGSESLLGSTSELRGKRGKQQEQALQLILNNTPEGSYEKEVARFWQMYPTCEDNEEMKQFFFRLLEQDITEHQKAFVYFWLATLSSDNINEAIYYYTLSTTSDIKSCTRETAAACALAELLFKVGETEAAYRYIKLAHEDANLYNSRFRHNTIERIMPIITEDRYELQHSRRMLVVYILIIMLVSTIIMAVLLGKLHKKNKALNNALDGLKSKQSELEEMTHSLSGLNTELKEANEIKDSFIRQSLYVSMDFVNDIEARCNEIVRKVKNQDYSSLKLLPYGMGIKEERRRLLRNFDHAFIKLFPNFLDEFNKLFPDDKKFLMGKDDELPPDVRIFALLRIGISDTSAVANFLNISTQSVYVYKTRIKSQSLVDNHEFESRIMEIR